jgi:signal transduction histidine kinase/ligand-binding sensor domain-containing protein/DNA-binding response OmpR family regulator
MGLKIRVSVLLFICMQQCIYAQSSKYKFSHLDITKGLSDNHINCIFKDKKGFMWFGTTSGLNRYDGYKFRIFKRDVKDSNSIGENYIMHIYEGPDNKMWVFTKSAISIYDPATEKFSNNIYNELTRYKILSNQITAVKKDKSGSFWFLTKNQGVYSYHPTDHRTEFYNNAASSKVILHSNYIRDIAYGQHSTIWIAYDDGIIDQLDTRVNKITKRYDGFAKVNAYKTGNYNLTLDAQQNLWIFSSSMTLGAYCFNTIKNTLSHFSKDTPGIRLNSNVVNDILQDDDNKIWIGTDHGGINIYDSASQTITYVVNKEDDTNSLNGNSVNLYKDDEGIIWASTFKQGINYYRSGMMQFWLARNIITDKSTLPYNDINIFAEDEEQNLWIGTNGGGLIYFDRSKNTYRQYKHDPSNPNSISNDIIIALHIDQEHKLWIGTYFGGLERFDGKNFTHYRHNDKIPESLSDDRVYTIMEDSKKNLWAGTFAGDLNIYDRKNNNFRHPKYPMSSDYTSILYEDKQGNIWAGRDRGVDVILKKTNTVKHYSFQRGNTNSLAGNDVNIIMEDSRGLVWIGTKDGMSILNPLTDKFIDIYDDANLPANNISSIIEDKNGNIWSSTNNGLNCISVTRAGSNYEFRINKYNEFDGLQGREFNLYAALKMRSGELAFGGPHGFNLFDPQRINQYKPKQHLLFTDFQLFNKSVAVGDTIKGNVVLTKSISETKAITLNYKENVFAIEFSGCDYFNPNKIHYEYTLEGFDKGWITTPTDDRKAIYTNLDAGDYLFKVRARNINNSQNVSSITLKITVLPPFWKSNLAYFIYAVLIIGLLLYIRHRGILKLKRQFEATQAKLEVERRITNEREEARRLHLLDLMKIKFFTNISHEFRTPLTLILSPIDDLLKISEKPDQQHHLVMIKKNGKRLLNLVNQLLDFRKMEYNELKLNLKKGDLVQFIKDVFTSFTDVAHQKQIKYHFESEVHSFVTDFDQDKIERIFFNLLSNAFKFTPPDGHVSIIIGMADSDIDDKKTLDIKVIDTGIGIARENQERIFERFFQDDVPENLLNQGSGIGLSITKEFVKMHGGNIELESEPDYGTCFTINLPFADQYDEQPVVEVKPDNIPAQVSKTAEEVPGSNKKPAVLLIEDNDDLRFYLKDNLKNTFHVIEAANGKDGWQKALALHPKLIVSDVNMPGINGIELCRKIKTDTRTSHIPVILLTALTAEEDQMAGLDSGASDYVVKPFNFEILVSRIQNLLKMQQVMKDTYQKQIEIQAQDVDVVSEDEKFLKKALEYIELNIANTNLSVESLSKHLNVSRGSLYKKLLTLTGKTPVDCIRTIRLKRAAQLLAKSQLCIANVAYDVGFNNPAYFAKVFREEYGILPSEYIIEMRSKEQEEVMA